MEDYLGLIFLIGMLSMILAVIYFLWTSIALIIQFAPVVIGSLLIMYGFFISSKFVGPERPWDQRFIAIGIGVSFLSLVMPIFFMANPIQEFDYAWVLRNGRYSFVTIAVLIALCYLLLKFADFLFEYQVDMAARNQHNQQKQNNNNSNNSKKEDDTRDEETEHTGMSEQKALDILRLSKPFTRQQLNSRRKELLTKFHPDRDGSNPLAALINQAYETLKSKASDA